jgi:hypothetical protein
MILLMPKKEEQRGFDLSVLRFIQSRRLGFSIRDFGALFLGSGKPMFHLQLLYFRRGLYLRTVLLKGASKFFVPHVLADKYYVN